MNSHAQFRTTRWSLVRASSTPSEEGRAALGELCERYWPALYALARRSGSTPDAAEDEVQGFLEGIIRRGDISRADETKGSFRSFLGTAFRHHLMNDAAAGRTLKRGGGVVTAPLDPEAHYRALDANDDPARIFERAFARRTLEAALERLRRDYESRGKLDQFNALRSTITAPDDSIDREEIANASGMTRGALDVAIHRLRSRYRDALLGAVRDVTESDEAAADELTWMFEVI